MELDAIWHNVLVYDYKVVSDTEINFFCYDSNYSVPQKIQVIKSGDVWKMYYGDYGKFSTLNLVDFVSSDFETIFNQGPPADNWCLDNDNDGIYENGAGNNSDNSICNSGMVYSCGDNCPDIPNPDQADSDGDRVGDVCDQCPSTPPGEFVDANGCTISPCTYSISPSNGSFTSSGGTSTVLATALSSDCTWTASENISWVSVSPTIGIGSAFVTITVTANTGIARSGSVTIAGQTYTISQTAPCTYSISPSSSTFTSSGGTSTLLVTASNSCAWTTSENLSWVSLSPTSGTGNGTVMVTVTANTGAARSGSVTIAGQTYTISQTAPCTYSISSTSGSYISSGGTSTVLVTTSSLTCAWTASENLSWVSLSPTSGTGNGTVMVTVTANTGTARNGSVIIAGQTYTINQTASCTYSILPTSGDFEQDGGTSSVSVTASSPTCAWTTFESLSWVSLSLTSGTGNRTVIVTVDAYDGPDLLFIGRSGSVTIAGQTYTISQVPEGISVLKPIIYLYPETIQDIRMHYKIT